MVHLRASWHLSLSAAPTSRNPTRLPHPETVSQGYRRLARDQRSNLPLVVLVRGRVRDVDLRDQKGCDGAHLLRVIGRCLKRAHEAEAQRRLEKAKLYAATGQRLLERLRRQSRP